MQLHIANLHCKCTGICTVTGYLHCKFYLFSKYFLTFVRKCGIIIRIYRTMQFLSTTIRNKYKKRTKNPTRLSLYSMDNDKKSGNPVGRPKKSSVSSKKKGGRGAVGRPKGDAAIINEYKARMLNSPRSRAVMDAIFDAALDPDHKNQAAAWKLVMDRILPVAAFEKDVTKDGGRSAIQINITGVGTTTISDGSEESQPIEGELAD